LSTTQVISNDVEVEPVEAEVEAVDRAGKEATKATVDPA
jgi:hypothetical protein